jgi:hypothetical protein
MLLVWLGEWPANNKSLASGKMGDVDAVIHALIRVFPMGDQAARVQLGHCIGHAR